MNRTFLIITFTFLCRLLMSSQATSLAIDCQNPGWLSSMINYGDQQTIYNLTITGYLNGTDIKFIRQLNLNRNLHGVINLENANFVAGGGAYYNSKYTKDNTFTDFMFADLKKMQKIILPKSLEAFDGSGQFSKTQLDTLVINGNMEFVNVGYFHSGLGYSFWLVRCIFFPEGVRKIHMHNLFSKSANLNNIELFFPSTLGWIDGSTSCDKDDAVFHCNSIRPDTITIGNYSNNYYSLFNRGTIYVPKGTKELYQQSIFRKLTIIEDILVEGIALENDSISIHIGETKTINASVFPEDAVNQDIIYESKDSNICSIDSTGYIKALSIGKTVIYAYSYNKEFVDSCVVQVFAHTSSVTVDTSIKLRLGEEVQLNGRTYPEESDGCIAWKSSNEGIATVNNNGLVKGISLGYCVVTATSVDGGFSADCLVTVVQPVYGVTIEKHTLSLDVGEQEQLYANIQPVNADNKRVIWSSSNSEIAEVDIDGNVTAKKSGIAFIKAESEDNPLAIDSCKVIVNQPVTGITLNHMNCELHRIGETLQLVATVLPEDASNKGVRWASSNESVCIVSNGTVVAVGFGTCVIIATTVDGNYIATCTIKVVEGADLPGDVNRDGEVNVADINATITIILGGIVDEQTMERADVNGDREINIADVNAIIKIILGN